MTLPHPPVGPRSPVEQVVLLDDERRPVGAMAKADVHSADTPLHLAFSCYVVNDSGCVLMTRRALTKATWPGVWTNSVCGHPAPDEKVADAVVRRARQELGIGLIDVQEVLPSFAYRAVDASGLVENEVCPVFVARADADPVPDPGEVAQWRWVQWDDLVDAVVAAPWALSPWASLQIGELDGVAWRPDDV